MLIEGICEGNLVVYLVTRTGRDLSLMTPSLPYSASMVRHAVSALIYPNECWNLQRQ